MYLIRELAKKYNLTRTALLHYDKIGLLKSSQYSEAGYRLYTDKDEECLKKIVLFRSMGIPLSKIKELITSKQSRLTNVLMKRLDEINREIDEKKNQQGKIIELLSKVNELEKYINPEDKDLKQFPILFGIDPVKWHINFENISPEMHRKFLKILNKIPEKLKKSINKSVDSLSQSERKKLIKFLH